MLLPALIFSPALHHRQASCGEGECVQLLMKGRKCNPLAQTEKGELALHLAAREGNYDVCFQRVSLLSLSYGFECRFERFFSLLDPAMAALISRSIGSVGRRSPAGSLQGAAASPTASPSQSCRADCPRVGHNHGFDPLG